MSRVEALAQLNLESMRGALAAVGLTHAVARIAVDPIPGAGREPGDLLLVAMDRENAGFISIVRGPDEGVVDVMLVAQQDGDHRCTMRYGMS